MNIPRSLVNLSLAFVSALILLLSVLVLSDQINRPVYAQAMETPENAARAAGQLAYTPAVTIVAPAAHTVLTTTHPPTYLIQIKHSCGTVCVGSAALDVVSVTMDGGGTYHPAVLDGSSGRYVYVWDLPAEDDVAHVIIARAINLGGITGTSDPVTVTVDQVAPSTSAQAPAIHEGLDPIPVRWKVADTASEVASVRLYYRYAFTGTLWLTDTVWQDSGLAAQSGFSGTFVFTPTKVGGYGFATQAIDQAGNQEPLPTDPDTWTEVKPATQYIFMPLLLRDFPLLPSGQIIIENGTSYTYNPQVTLTLQDIGQKDSIAEMRLRNASGEWESWQPFTNTVNWSLPADSSGLKTVEAQFKGTRDGITYPVSDAIYLSHNGSFEKNALSPEWQVKADNALPWSIKSSVPERSSGSTLPAHGQYIILLGNTDYPCSGVPRGRAAIERDFQIPSGATKLVFRYIIWSQDLSTKSDYDRFEVYINGALKHTDGNLTRRDTGCEKWWRVPGPENPRNGQESGWATGEIDVSGYAGSTINVSFENWSRFDNWYNTYTFLDAVRIEGNW